MTNKNKKPNKGVSPVAVGVAGAAVVAAGVAAVALSKKENRKKAGKILNKAKTSGKALGKKAAAGLDKVQQFRSTMEATPVKKVSKKRSAGTSRKSSTKSANSSHSRIVNSKMVN